VDSTLLDVTPRSVIFIIVFAGSLLSFELGFAIGKRRRHRDEEKNLGPMVTGVLGLVAFILALTYSMAVNRHDQRKQNVLSDANAISTAYLRATLAANPEGARIRGLLVRYTNQRAHFMEYENLHDLLNETQAIQMEIWKQVLALNDKSPGPATVSLASALTQVFDMHEKRIHDGIYNRLETNVWVVVISIVLLGMLMLGVQSGFNRRQSLVGLVPFALALAAVVALIADMDNPQAGMFIVSQQPMLDTLQTIRSYEATIETGVSRAP
jgi:hypothetical protein